MMLLYAWADAPSYEQVNEAVEWLFETITYPAGKLLAVEIFQAADNPSRVAFTERWTSLEDFLNAAESVGYTDEIRAEFLSRAGIDPDTVTSQVWTQADHPQPRVA